MTKRGILAMGAGAHGFTRDRHIHLNEKHSHGIHALTPLNARTAIELAERQGVTEIGFVKHNGLYNLRIGNKNKRLKIVQGGEFNAYYFDSKGKKQTFHMLVHLPSGAQKEFLKRVNACRILSIAQAMEAIEHLSKKLGLTTSHINFARLLKLPNITKRDLALLLLKNKRNKIVLASKRIHSYADFKRAHAKGHYPLFSNFSVGALDLIKAAHELGGEVTIAHPKQIANGLTERALFELAEAGVDRIEIAHPTHSIEKTETMIKIIKSMKDDLHLPIRAEITSDLHSKSELVKPIDEELLKQMISLI